MTIVIDPGMHAAPMPVRVGGYPPRPGRAPRYEGPDGTGRWSSRRIRERTLFYQEEVFDIVPTARIRANGHLIRVFDATLWELRLIDASLALVPPAHLARVTREKPEGFRVSQTAGRAGSLSYTGGLNAMADYAETPGFDESRGICVTHGALWRWRDLGISPTLLHEIGHVMTHRPALISYAPFPQARREALAGTRVSRNPGALEALCNCYMYMICHGAGAARLRGFATGGGIQNDAVTRAAMRATPAFSTALPPDWQSRYAERQGRP